MADIENIFIDWKKNRFFMYNIADKYFPSGICNYNAWYTINHPWIIIRYILLEIKYAWQRVFRGYDDTVIWSIDIYLAEKIPLWVEQLKNNRIGVPSIFLNNDESNFEDARQRFQDVLNQIIEGFQAFTTMNETVIDYGSDEYKILEKKFHNGFELFHKYFDTLWS